MGKKMNYNCVNIGKGMLRINVKNKRKRRLLTRIEGVTVDGSRVIFPAWMFGNIFMLMTGRKRLETKAIQLDLFAQHTATGH